MPQDLGISTLPVSDYAEVFFWVLVDLFALAAC
jgi:hypothetical protein